MPPFNKKFDKPMNFQVKTRTLSNRVAKTTGVNQLIVHNIVLSFFEELKSEMINGNFVSVSGFCRFDTRYIRSNNCGTGKKGESNFRPALYAPFARFGRVFRYAVKGNLVPVAAFDYEEEINKK